MICQECKAAGQTSRVSVGGGCTTAMYCPPFYDEEGKYHSHDLNTVTTSYSCSNGHRWSESGLTPCWCGWPKETK